MSGTKDSPPVYYWDTCVFLKWMNGEEHPIGALAAIREVANQARKREAILVTSSLTLVEVLPVMNPAGALDMFDEYLKHEWVETKSLDRPTSRLARQIRNYYQERKDQFGGKTLSTPDAIHVATAIICKATVMHTFDSGKKAKTLGLLPLSGNVANHALRLSEPIASQFKLDL